MARANTKIGDVFSVKLDDNTKKYIQYVANDLTQLNSDVIRAFKKTYPINETPDLSEVVKGEVEFYAHTVTKWGIKLVIWEKVGNIADIGKVELLFRDTNDYGSKPGEQVKVSDKWYVWKINEKFKQVGKLEGEYQKAEIGVVIPAVHIVHRLRTGEYDFVYPEFE
jgi:hypothetical protein